MDFSTDKYLDRKFKLSGKDRYNCWDLVRDVWLDITGNTLEDLTPVRAHRTDLWVAATESQSKFTEITKPTSPCIVLMQRAKDIPHIGVYVEGKVLHITPNGVIYQDLEVARAGFSSVMYYVMK